MKVTLRKNTNGRVSLYTRNDRLLHVPQEFIPPMIERALNGESLRDREEAEWIDTWRQDRR